MFAAVVDAVSSIEANAIGTGKADAAPQFLRAYLAKAPDEMRRYVAALLGELEDEAGGTFADLPPGDRRAVLRRWSEPGRRVDEADALRVARAETVLSLASLAMLPFPSEESLNLHLTPVEVG